MQYSNRKFDRPILRTPSADGLLKKRISDSHGGEEPCRLWVKNSRPCDVARHVIEPHQCITRAGVNRIGFASLDGPRYICFRTRHSGTIASYYPMIRRTLGPPCDLLKLLIRNLQSHETRLRRHWREAEF